MFCYATTEQHILMLSALIDLYLFRYLNLGSYKKNLNQQNMNPNQKNGPNQNMNSPGTSTKSKNEKSEEIEKAKRTYFLCI